MVFALLIAVVALIIICGNLVVRITTLDFKQNLHQPSHLPALISYSPAALPLSAQQLIKKKLVKLSYRKQVVNRVAAGFYNLILGKKRNPLINDTAFYYFISGYTADKKDVKLCLFPDAKLAYVMNFDNTWGQLVQLTPGLNLKILFEHNPQYRPNGYNQAKQLTQ